MSLTLADREMLQEAELTRELSGPGLSRQFNSSAQPLPQCPTGNPVTVDGFGRYQNAVASLPPQSRHRLEEIAQAITRSYSTACQPVRTVQIYGHADWDTPRNLQRELLISQQRARIVMDWLMSRVGPSIASRVTWDHAGFGALQTVAPATSEANRKLNRRVEIFLLNQAALPACSCPLPGHPLFNSWLQNGLRTALKTPQVKVDGIFTPQTQVALRNFQGKSGLAATGRMDRATYLKLLSVGTPPAPCTASSSIAGIDAAVRELKSKINDCNPVEDGMGFWGLTCGSAVNRMVAELRSKGAFPGCKRKDRRVNEKLYKSISHEGTGRCCVAQYRPDLGDIIKKLRDAIDDGFLVVTSVLSGTCTGQGGSCSDRTCCDDPGPRKPFPDHWMFIIGHDGANKFVFWDPDGFFTNGASPSNATRHCNGFGFFFFDATAGRFTTAASDAEMSINGAGDHTSLSRQGESRIGVTCCKTTVASRQHRYQALSVVTV